MVTDLKKQKPSLKVILSVGGWNLGSQPFASVVASNETRKHFVTHAIEYLRKRNFDGLDIDWEYPADRGSGPEDKERFTYFLKVSKDYLSIFFIKLALNELNKIFVTS